MAEQNAGEDTPPDYKGGDYVSTALCTFILVCKIPLLARALGLKARPSARATIGYLVYNIHSCCYVLTFEHT